MLRIFFVNLSYNEKTPKDKTLMLLSVPHLLPMKVKYKRPVSLKKGWDASH